MSDTLNVLIQTCPVCNGQGRVSMPPWIPGDVPTWSASGIETYDCRACGGTGLIRRDVPTAPGRAAVVEPPREGPLSDELVAHLREHAEYQRDHAKNRTVLMLACDVLRLCDTAAALRSALSAAQQDSDRIDWLESWAGGDQGICPPGNHGGDAAHWLFYREDDARSSRLGRWADEGEGPTLREAIDAARAAVSPSPEPRT